MDSLCTTDNWLMVGCSCSVYVFVPSVLSSIPLLSFLLLLKLLWQVSTECMIDSLHKPRTISQDTNDKALSVGVQLTPFTIYGRRVKAMHLDNPANLISPLSLRQESLHKHLQLLWAFKKEQKHVFSHSTRLLNHFQTSSNKFFKPLYDDVCCLLAAEMSSLKIRQGEIIIRGDNQHKAMKEMHTSCLDHFWWKQILFQIGSQRF